MRQGIARRALFFIALSLTVSCSSRALTAVQGVTELVSASHSGLRDARRSVITDEPGWASLWKAIHADVTPEPPRPSVNLAQQVVIVAALGERPTGGFAIHIDSVRSGSAGREVFVTTTKPAPTCMTTQMLTQPVHAVSAPVIAGSTRFVEAERTEECSG